MSGFLDKKIYLDGTDRAALMTHKTLRLPSTTPLTTIEDSCLKTLQLRMRREIKNYDDRYFTMLLYLKLGNSYLRISYLTLGNYYLWYHYMKLAQQAYQAALSVAENIIALTVLMTKTAAALSPVYESSEGHSFDVAIRFLKSAAWALSVGAYSEAEGLFRYVAEMDSDDKDCALAEQGLVDTLSAKKSGKKPFSYFPLLKFPFYARFPQPNDEKVDDAANVVEQFSSLNIRP